MSIPRQIGAFPFKRPKDFATISPRSLFIRVEPAPTSLSERRAVLRTLQRYGEIQMFKKLADGRSFISLASTTEMARNLILRSPMKVEFLSEKFDSIQPWSSSEIAAPIQPIEIKSSPPSESTRRQTATVAHKSFILNIHPGDKYKHKTLIRLSPLHGPWPDDEAAKDSFIYNALKDVMPERLGTDALCDWQTGGQLSDEARIERESSKHAHINDRVARRERALDSKSFSPLPLGSRAAEPTPSEVRRGTGLALPPEDT